MSWRFASLIHVYQNILRECFVRSKISLNTYLNIKADVCMGEFGTSPYIWWDFHLKDPNGSRGHEINKILTLFLMQKQHSIPTVSIHSFFFFLSSTRWLSLTKWKSIFLWQWYYNSAAVFHLTLRKYNYICWYNNQHQMC